MDIKELVERVARRICTLNKYVGSWDDLHESTKEAWRGEAKELLEFLGAFNLAWVIRDGNEVPLGVEIETHHVILLKKALKEVNNG